MSEHNDNTRIRIIREKLGYTQEEFAEILDLSLSGYKKLERGVVSLSIDKIYILNKKLGLSADYILFDEKTELDNVWPVIFRLSEQEKVNLFLRMFAYFSGVMGDETVLENCMNFADNIEKEFISKQDGEK